MVFPGRFSTGCLRCRQRKVKCDEAKPSCRRCYIYGKECPGYTDQFHFRHGLTASNFSPEKPNARLASQSNRKDGKTATARARKGAAVVKQEEEEEQVPGTDVWTHPVVRPPKPSYDDVSLAYFVRRFVSPDGSDGFPGHLTFLPNMFDHYGQGVLELATLSVAKMAAYNQFGGDEFRIQSYQTYGRAIKRLQASIQSEADATDDKVLASILLLCTLKDITGESTGDPNEHAAGLFYLLEKRGVEQLATTRGVELFILALIRLQVYSFLRGDDSYSDPGGVASVLGEFDPLIRAISMMSKTLALRHQLSKFVTFPDLRAQTMAPQEMSPPSPADVHVKQDPEGHAQAVGACLQALGDFDAWDGDAAQYWQNTFEGRTLPTGLGEVGIKMTYCDPPTACTIILVRSARLITLLTVLTYHNMMTLAGDEACVDISAWDSWLPTLQLDVNKTIDDILACVPFVLGDVAPNGQPTTMTYDGAGAIVITQPLRLVTYCVYSTPEQVEVARKMLERLNATIGIRSAVSWEGESLMAPTWNSSPPKQEESPSPGGLHPGLQQPMQQGMQDGQQNGGSSGYETGVF